MQVHNVMTREVDLVAPSTPLVAAARTMRDRDVGCLPVGEGDRLVGMVTDRDLVVRALAEGMQVHAATVRDVMSAEVLFCFEDQTVEEASGIMAENQVRRLPVLDRRDRLVGIVSLSDLLSGGGPRTRPHQVTFYKRLTDSSGHPHDVPLATVHVTGRHATDEVVAAAKRRFARDRGIGSWNELADGYEVGEAH